jgi:endonuclease YncB( thermonuclease family)
MPNRFRIAIFTVLLIFYGFVNAAEILEGKVVGVHDGDTVTLLIAGNQQVKIRLAQIDAPELAQAFGEKSRQSLADLVFSQNVKVEKETIDKYGRTVGTIIVDGVDANREQVKRGMAWVYQQYMHDQTLLADEEKARQAKVGLWADSNPMRPSEYRHGGKNAKVPKTEQAPKVERTDSQSNYTCGEKRYCKEMTSCDEAKFYLTQCGLNRLDRDGDGVPCESICNKSR